MILQVAESQSQPPKAAGDLILTMGGLWGTGNTLQATGGGLVAPIESESLKKKKEKKKAKAEGSFFGLLKCTIVHLNTAVTVCF